MSEDGPTQRASTAAYWCAFLRAPLPLLLQVLMLGSVGAADAMPRGTFAFVPEAPFIRSADEKVHVISITSRPVTDVQKIIDAAREAHPDAVLIVNLEGQFTVKSQPLRLRSNTNLLFLDGSNLKAVSSATSTCMIEVKDAEYVSVAGPGQGLNRGTIDGNGRAHCGIRVTNSGKVNLFNISIQNCVKSGVEYSGRKPEMMVKPEDLDWEPTNPPAEKAFPVFGDGATVTGCRISDSGGNGLVVRTSGQFMCTGSEFISNRGAGIDIDSNTSLVADNIFTDNGVGLITHSDHAVVARNLFSNNTLSVQFSAASKLNQITYNRIGIHVDGESNSIYYNHMDHNHRDFDKMAGSGNVVAGNRNLSGAQIIPLLGDNIYFNPPTRSNPHEDEVVVAGMGRQDIEIAPNEESMSNGGPRPKWAGRQDSVVAELEKRGFLDLREVQERIEHAQIARPDDYLVVHLYGLFVATAGPVGLTIPDHVSVILHENCSLIARFEADTTYTQPVVVSMSGEKFSSISGGFIDGGSGNAYRGIQVPGAAISVIDEVTVTSVFQHGITTFGMDSTGEREKTYFTGRGRPLFIRGNNILNCGNMGLWGHVRNDALYIDNLASDNFGGGILHDAGNHYSPAMFNVCSGNKRCGLWLELGASHNILYGNVLKGNVGRHSTGVISYCQYGGPNTNNVIAGNLIEGGHLVGIHLRNAAGNMIYNNIVRNNEIGFLSGWGDYGNNFVTQNLINDNTEDFSQNKQMDHFAFPRLNSSTAGLR